MNTVFLVIFISYIYLWLGFFFRYREKIYRPRCPLGPWPTTTTVLFWPWKITVVFWKKWRRG